MPEVREEAYREAPEMMPASAPSVTHSSRHKKRIYSKPLDIKTCDNVDLAESERERKLQRIARLRLQTTNERQVQSAFNEHEDFEEDYEKELMLIKIQKVREAKKQQMMTMPLSQLRR